MKSKKYAVDNGLKTSFPLAGLSFGKDIVVMATSISVLFEKRHPLLSERVQEINFYETKSKFIE